MATTRLGVLVMARSMIEPLVGSARSEGRVYCPGIRAAFRTVSADAVMNEANICGGTV